MLSTARLALVGVTPLAGGAPRRLQLVVQLDRVRVQRRVRCHQAEGAPERSGFDGGGAVIAPVRAQQVQRSARLALAVGRWRRAAAPAGEPKRLQPRPQRSIGPRRHLAAHLAAAAAAASVASAAFAASLAALVATTVAPRSARRRSAPHEAASPRREVAPQPRLAATVATATTTIASAAPVAGRCRVRARRQRRARRAARELQAVCDGRTQQPSRLRPAAHARARQQRRIHLV